MSCQGFVHVAQVVSLPGMKDPSETLPFPKGKNREFTARKILSFFGFLAYFQVVNW